MDPILSKHSLEKIENEDNTQLNGNKTRIQMRKISKPFQFFSFWDSFCFSCCILNSKKRHFVRLISKIIDEKLSVEYILELSNNFEMLKKIVLDEEQYENFGNLPPFTLTKQMEELDIK